MPIYSPPLTIPIDIRLVAESADKLLMVDTNNELFIITKEDFFNGFVSPKEYFDKLVFLAHFNGTNNSTALVDVKGNIITHYGDSKISTAQSKFGNGSLLLDGAGDYLSFPHTPEINILQGDFKLELWYYPLAVTGFIPIVSQWSQVSGRGGFIFGLSESSVIFYFSPFSGGIPLLSGGNLEANNWYHIAVTRIGNEFTLWINGVVVSVGSNSGTKQLNNVNFSVGTYYNEQSLLGSTGASDCYAHINELRITKPTPFAVTVPTQTFPDS
ncbi:LamG domain-containing protein [Nostoc sp.]|uniref:LamG domain-containing protein n=1 Tax=Nostoc sp. TaxID=1180 RepID=UPI002FFA1AA4